MGGNNVNKVVGREYLFRQFVNYNNINKLNMRILDRKIARLFLKIDHMQSVLNQNNITVDFTDIDSLTDAEIDEMFTPSITISGSGVVILNETSNLTANESGVTWYSSDDTRATVDQNGVVRGVSLGTVTITASKNGFNSGTISVEVYEGPEGGGGGGLTEEEEE